MGHPLITLRGNEVEGRSREVDRRRKKRRWRPQQSRAATTPLASGGRHWHQEAERARSARTGDERRPRTVSGGGRGGGAGGRAWPWRRR